MEKRQCIEIICLFFIILLSNLALGNEYLHAVDNWGLTRMKAIKLNYLWTIDNFSLYNKENAEYITSPIFSSPKNDTFKWYLKVYPKGEKDYPDKIGIYLMYESGPLRTLEANTATSILNATRNKVMTIKIKNPFEMGSGWGSNSFINRSYVLDEKNGILSNDRLNIFTELTFYPSVLNISGNCNIRDENQLENQFSDHLEHLLEDGKSSEAVLIARNQKFHVDKAILSSRSTVFSALFVNETKDCEVQVIDVDPDVMKEALYYIYTGRLHNLETMAKELLKVASSYKIDGLQALCEESICKSLNVDNAVDVLNLADHCKADKLKSKAINFIAAHASELINTEKFKTFQTSHPEVIVEVFNIIAKNELI